jgi:hypothetical protein
MDLYSSYSTLAGNGSIGNALIELDRTEDAVDELLDKLSIQSDGTAAINELGENKDKK